jgi:hypothetical protein
VDGAADLLHSPADRDAEHALAALEQVDDLLRGRALVDGGAVGEQRDPGEVADAADPQVVDRDPDVVQRDPGVEQPLDDLEDQDVLERVQPLRAGAVGGADAGCDQLRPGPVVELAVGDAGDLARGRAAVAHQLVGQRLVGEQLTLLASCDLNRLLLGTSLDHASLPSPDRTAGE